MHLRVKRIPKCKIDKLRVSRETGSIIFNIATFTLPEELKPYIQIFSQGPAWLYLGVYVTLYSHTLSRAIFSS